MKQQKQGARRAAKVARLKNVRHKTVTHKVHHRKPYRLRHLGSLAVAIFFLMALMLNLGYMIGSNRVVPQATTQTVAAPTSLTAVRSNLGFSFALDTNLLNVSASALENGTIRSVEQDQLRADKDITTVVVKPRTNLVRGAEAAAQLTFQVNPDISALTKLKQQAENLGLSDGEVALKLFPVTDSTDFDISLITSNNEILDGVSVRKSVYQLTPKFGNSRSPIYAVNWTGSLDGRAFSLRLNGLVGNSDTPTVFAPIFDTLNLTAAQKVAAAVTTKTLLPRFAAANQPLQLDAKYTSDLYSPAVVKVYHFVCGVLTVDGAAVTKDTCSGGTGSGFITSADGYVATNGHVISYTAKDMFVEALLNNPSFFVAFLRASGLNNAQIAAIARSPELLASFVTKIYELPDDVVKFDNQRETTLVSLGSTPMVLNSQEDVNKAVSFSETKDIKKAEILGMDYSSKDVYSSEGFSSSDVALLKINVTNAPFVTLLGEGSSVNQSQKIIVMGFPGDAENGLIDNDTLGVTVTNGTISSIRDAAGGKYKLFQSDADASHGNSGGPAITEDGQVFGLLTYRYQSEQSENAAKSYIRDIADFKKLATDKNITFNTASETQRQWNKGIEYFSQSRLTKANKEFAKVKAAYPSHRLVDTYIQNANSGIAAGKDVKDFPIAILLAGIAVVLAAVVVSVVMIARHRSHHQIYQVNSQYGTVPAPGMPYPVSTSAPVPTPQPGLGVQQPLPPQPQQFAPAPQQPQAPQYAAPQPQIIQPPQNPQPPTVQ